MKEEWKEIEGFENYSISNFGRLKNKRGINTGCYDKDGYKIVLLYPGRKNKKIHKLVYETFNNCKVEWPNTINHINKIKDDNRLENLNVMTTQDNTRYSLKGIKREPFTEEHKRKISLSKIGKGTKGINTKKISRNGVVFESINEASLKNNISLRSIYGYLGGYQKPRDGSIWKYI